VKGLVDVRVFWFTAPAAVLCLLFAGCRATAAAPPLSPPLFSDDERARLVAYWNAPGRYTISAPPEARESGPWQVRLTPDGSAWLLAYQRAVSGPAKLPPTLDAGGGPPLGATVVGTNVSTAGWETWVQSKITHDRVRAQNAADAANAQAQGRSAPAVVSPPPPLGPIPASLLLICGNPPPFAGAVTPLRHVVSFEDEPGALYVFADNVKMRDRYAYYRFAQGTVAYGPALRDLPPAELDALFAQAGMTASEQKIARAVSKLEGGFETVNTYDTGFISVGFVQFIAAEDGKGSLFMVLAREKTDRPAAFADDFRRFGIDVDPAAGTLAVVDPGTGAEVIGPAAVRVLIADKRLTAVFQRAGRKSAAFRVAQVQVAKSGYWPADDPVTVIVDGRTLTGKVSDVVRSEAGLATLFDRKINRGNIAPFADVVARVMVKKGYKSLPDAARSERDIVKEMKYRADFLADRTLSQPK